MAIGLSSPGCGTGMPDRQRSHRPRPSHSVIDGTCLGDFCFSPDRRSPECRVPHRLVHGARESHALGPYLAVGRGFRGQLAILRGDTKVGVEGLRRNLAELHAARYELLTTIFNISLVQGLAAIAQFTEGLARIDETIRLVEANEDFVYLPELLRVKGAMLLSLPRRADEEAVMFFMQSLVLSRRQGARAWELRTAIDLAALLASQGHAGGARMLLRPVFERVTEGFDTADVSMAQRLLTALG